jgi:muramoyltetrapeptide carboxypeptidase
MQTPHSLYPGARVALLCPSSPVEEDRLAPAVEAVRALGLEPVVYPSCQWENRHGYFAADDGQRAKDLQNAFSDPAIQGIWCLRGGYGANRLLPLLNLRDMARHPKVFCGYSDVTALHIALNEVCSLVTYHTPMPASDAAMAEDDFTMAYLRRALFGALTGPMPLGEGTETLAPGSAKGPLCGGNLSLVRDSLGAPWEIDTKGKILFLEDVDETPQRIDAALTQLRNAGKLDSCAGFLLGQWTRCGEDRERREIFRELLLPTGKPILAGLPCGHCLPTLSLPLGATVVLDAGAKTLEVLP